MFRYWWVRNFRASVSHSRSAHVGIGIVVFRVSGFIFLGYWALRLSGCSGVGVWECRSRV